MSNDKFVVKLKKNSDTGVYTVGIFDELLLAKDAASKLNEKSQKGYYYWEKATHNPSVEQMAQMY